jgi:hypothetical protein
MAAFDAKPVRFSALIDSSGKPEVYLPLTAPGSDRTFQKAVKERRVVSVKQEPTSTRKDFGFVGFLNEKFVSYLIFPKPLKAAEGQRVIGLKYDLIEKPASSVSSDRDSQREAVASRRRDKASRSPKPRLSIKPARPKTPLPPPIPKQFAVKFRITTVSEREVSVSAFTKSEAQRNAIQELTDGGALSEAKIKVVAIKPKG